MDTPFFRKFASTLFSRHLWGIGNDAADKASRFRNAEAEAIVRGLGLEPQWHALPSWVFMYYEEVVRRLMEMDLPPLKSFRKIQGLEAQW